MAASGTKTLLYAERYCAQVVEFMGRGYSLTAFAGEIGVSRATLERWCEVHRPFAAAVQCGHARRARLLEDRLLAAKGPSAVEAQIEALKTAAPDDWPPAEASGTPALRPAPRTRPAARRPLRTRLELPDNGRG